MVQVAGAQPRAQIAGAQCTAVQLAGAQARAEIAGAQCTVL